MLHSWMLMPRLPDMPPQKSRKEHHTKLKVCERLHDCVEGHLQENVMPVYLSTCQLAHGEYSHGLWTSQVHTIKCLITEEMHTCSAKGRSLWGAEGVTIQVINTWATNNTVQLQYTSETGFRSNRLHLSDRYNWIKDLRRRFAFVFCISW